MESIYYTLVASLPHLPHFTKAERLPITRQRLRERLQMLSPEDRELVQRAADFLAWQRQPATRRDAEMAKAYQKLQEKIDSPDLWSLFAFPLNVRTVLAALRRRRRGLPPTPGEFWGVGPWVRHLEQHWDHPDFKLANVFPWLPQARQLLETHAALELERFLMDLIWQHVERVAPGFEFSLRTVLAYLFKWDLLQLWLAQDPLAAAQRFDSLVTGVLDDYGPIFA
jgi:hypothetical protein